MEPSCCSGPGSRSGGRRGSTPQAPRRREPGADSPREGDSGLSPPRPGHCAPRPSEARTLWTRLRRGRVARTSDCRGLAGGCWGARSSGVRTCDSYSCKGQASGWWSTLSLPPPLLTGGRSEPWPTACGGSAPCVGPPRRGRPWVGAAPGSSGRRGRRPRRASGRAGKHGASALLPIFPVSVLYCFLLLKLTCLIGNWCRIVSRGLLWNISTAVSLN